MSVFSSQSNNPAASIYIHVPFCKKKCQYCDFYSITDLTRIPDYLSGLEKEIRLRSDKNTVVETIYFGGGTPSALAPEEISKILETVHRHFTVRSDAEVTLEMNPGTLRPGYFGELRRAGVNRISIGVQSFNDKKLEFLGRIHTAKEALITIESAALRGFENISIDMMFGLPFETRSLWEKDLGTAVSVPAVHLSCYMLTIESCTPLARLLEQNAFIPLEDATRFSLFKDTVRILEKAGYDHYEISSYAKGGHNRSRHNSKYWDMSPYIGMGPAAHSYDGRDRSWHHQNVDAYLETIFSGNAIWGGIERLTISQRVLEMVMLSLRVKEGVDLALFRSMFDIDFEKRFAPIIEQTREEGLAETDNNRYALTLEGQIRLDSILEAFADRILTN